jgi:hypothetical protein
MLLGVGVYNGVVECYQSFRRLPQKVEIIAAVQGALSMDREGA